MTTERAEGIERRKHRRYYHPAKAVVSWGGNGRSANGDVVDLSTGGCQLRLDCESELQVGDSIAICLQSSHLSLQLAGTVRRCAQAGTLIGVAFAPKVKISEPEFDRNEVEEAAEV